MAETVYTAPTSVRIVLTVQSDSQAFGQDFDAAAVGSAVKNIIDDEGTYQVTATSVEAEFVSETNQTQS